MTDERFEELVREAIELIPPRFREEMRNVAVVVEARPSPELLDEMEIHPPDTLYGLYQGTPLPDRGWDYGNAMPDRITIFREPILEDAAEGDDHAVVRCIGETVVHEFGHYFGLSEAEIEEIEARYWRHDEAP